MPNAALWGLTTVLLWFCAHGYAQSSAGESPSDPLAGSSGRIARSKPITADDKRFLDYAAQDNQAEIQPCLVAEKQSKSPEVKAFARLMVKDHVDVESRLAALINGVGTDVPNDIGREGNETMSRLQGLRGTEFDRAFMQAQVEDHEHDIEKFQKEIGSTRNDGIRSFGSETVETLEQHLALAKAVRTSANARSKSPESTGGTSRK